MVSNLVLFVATRHEVSRPLVSCAVQGNTDGCCAKDWPIARRLSVGDQLT